MAHDSQARIAIRAGNLAGILLVVVPLLNLVNVWPLNPHSTSWRFGAFGLIANTLLLPVVGAVLLATAATWAGGRWRLWTVAALTGGVSVALLILLGLFALDALQERSQIVTLQSNGVVREGGLMNFDFNVAKAALQGFAALIACGLISYMTWRGARQASDREAAGKNIDSSMLVVGTPPGGGGGSGRSAKPPRR